MQVKLKWDFYFFFQQQLHNVHAFKVYSLTQVPTYILQMSRNTCEAWMTRVRILILRCSQLQWLWLLKKGHSRTIIPLRNKNQAHTLVNNMDILQISYIINDITHTHARAHARARTHTHTHIIFSTKDHITFSWCLSRISTYLES